MAEEASVYRVEPERFELIEGEPGSAMVHVRNVLRLGLYDHRSIGLSGLRCTARFKAYRVVGSQDLKISRF